MTKTDAQVKAIEKKRLQAVQLKSERRNQQARNVKRKLDEKVAHKERSMGGMGKKTGGAEGHGDGSEDETGGMDDPEENQAYSDDDDAQYFRNEVGEEPDEELFRKPAKRPKTEGGAPKKKGRFNEKYKK